MISIPKQNNLNITHPEIASQLVNTELGETLTYGSNKKVDWSCQNGHIYSCTVTNRTCLGRGCPYCSGRLCVEGVNDLQTMYPELAKEWGQSNPMKPNLVSAHSGKMADWVCKNNHKWSARIISRSKNNAGCRKCSLTHTSRAEQALLEYASGVAEVLDKKIMIPFGNKKSMKVDCHLSPNIIIEYDGEYFHKSDDALERDIRKTELLLSSGYFVIRFREVVGTKILPLLPIEDENFYQTHVVYDTESNNLRAAFKEWWIDNDELHSRH